MFDKEIFSKRLLDATKDSSAMHRTNVIGDSEGISYGRFMSLCNAEEEPTISELCKLSEVLHVPTDYLLGISSASNTSTEQNVRLDKLIKRYKHKLERVEVREASYEEANNLSVHGYWSKGWYSARAHTLDDIIEDLQELKDSL